MAAINTMRERAPDDAKLRELILYISRQSDGDTAFSSVKLNKLLFLADFLAFLKIEQAITWQPYVRQTDGPAPARLNRIIDQMAENRELAMRVSNVYGNPQQRPIALTEPNLGMFSGEEIALVDRVISDCWGVTASKISDASHDFIGWRLAALDELIPYETALIGSRPPTRDEIARGQELDSPARSTLAAHVA